jgi:hypothetical protein
MTSNRDDLIYQRAVTITNLAQRLVSYEDFLLLERNIQHPVVCLVVIATTDEFSLFEG